MKTEFHKLWSWADIPIFLGNILIFKTQKISAIPSVNSNLKFSGLDKKLIIVMIMILLLCVYCLLGSVLGVLNFCCILVTRRTILRSFDEEAKAQIVTAPICPLSEAPRLGEKSRSDLFENPLSLHCPYCLQKDSWVG